MKINEKQFVMLFLIAKESLKFYDYAGVCSYEERKKLVDDIENQLSGDLVDVENIKSKRVLNG